MQSCLKSTDNGAHLSDGMAELKMTDWCFDKDIDFVTDAARDVWPTLRGAKIFITGGTGFIGCWLLESLCRANSLHGLEMKVFILTRDPQAFQRKAPHLAAYPGFTFVPGDVCNFASPAAYFTHVIHAATDASAHLNETNPLRMFDTVLNGTRRVLDFAVEKNVERVLFLSSGAVYGRQPWEMEKISESWRGGPNCVNSRYAYAEGKRAAEMLCTIYGNQFGLKIAIARIFALLGPYLSLDIHFAAGNFIRDAIKGKQIMVNGNGLPCRSYLYAADLAVWLLHMLVRAEPCKPYNVGSDDSISIRDLAKKVSDVLGNVGYQILGAPDAGWNPGRYVPETSLITRELGLHKTVTLDQAILRTALWHGWERR